MVEYLKCHLLTIVQIIKAVCILGHGTFGPLLEVLLPEFLHKKVQYDIELGHGALVRKRVQQSKFLLCDRLLHNQTLGSLLCRASFLMACEIGRKFGLVAAPSTSVDFGLVLWSLFRADLRSKDRGVDLPLVSLKLLLSLELLTTALDITEDPVVSKEVGLEVGHPLCGIITTLILTSLDLVPDTSTLPDVGCFVVNH